jgi:LysM repeat protein
MWHKLTVFAALGGLVVTGTAAGRVHTIQKGETLGGIASRYGVTLSALAAANGLADPNRIVAGSVLSIPGPATGAPAPSPAATTVRATGSSHTIQLGETLEQVARRYGVSVSALAAANGIADPDVVRAGIVLHIPSGASAAAAPVPSTAQSVVVPMPPATLAAVQTGPRIVVPPDRAVLRSTFLRFSRLAGVPSDLAMALAWQESGWQQHVTSRTGAVGVMQMQPETGLFTGQFLLAAPVNLADVDHNVRAGVRFLAYLLKQTGGDERAAVASYYQGLRSVRRRGLTNETRHYVANVIALKKRFARAG